MFVALSFSCIVLVFIIVLICRFFDYVLWFFGRTLEAPIPKMSGLVKVLAKVWGAAIFRFRY